MVKFVRGRYKLFLRLVSTQDNHAFHFDLDMHAFFGYSKL